MKKPVLIAVVAIALLAPVLYLFVLPKLTGSGEAKVGAATSATPAAGAGPTLVLAERVLNLLSAPSDPHYLRIEIALEFEAEKPSFYKLSGAALSKANDEFKAAMQPKLPAIDDAVVRVVSSRTVAQLSTPQGMEELKSDLGKAITAVVGTPKLRRVYFTRFLTQ